MKTEEVLFIGGPIDGERRKIPVHLRIYYVWVEEDQHRYPYLARKFYDTERINGSVEKQKVSTIMVDTSTVSSVFDKLTKHYQPQKETIENDNPKASKQ